MINIIKMCKVFTKLWPIYNKLNKTRKIKYRMKELLKQQMPYYKRVIGRKGKSVSLRINYSII